MDAVLAARTQMGFSLGFHMLFAAAGMALPLMMVIAEGIWLRTGNQEALRLAKRWAKATAVLFAIGAVSGTALSFELGLLWPQFMALAGPLIGPAFALEGYAFFLEAIFLGLYLYGWDRVSPRAHWLSGVAVSISGTFSGIIVLATVSWMQSPTGFQVGPDGLATEVNPLQALFNPAFGLMVTHSTVSTYQAIGFAVAGIYAWALLKNHRPERAQYNRMALVIAMSIATLPALAQPVIGDFLAKRLYHAQPAKLAAMEGQFRTEAGAPLRIFGWPVPEDEETYWAIEIPRGLSFLATGDPDAVVLGLEEFPRELWPPVQPVHVAFQLMVGAGFLMAGLAGWFWAAWWLGRRRGRDWVTRRPLLTALVLGSPLGFLALETGWIVTEMGRQPWIIYEIMSVSDAVTPIAGLTVSLAGFVLIYSGLIVAVLLLLRRMARGEDEEPHPPEETYSAHG
jgi:cytochrome bd ubiquinol oxidase subunit I